MRSGTKGSGLKTAGRGVDGTGESAGDGRRPRVVCGKRDADLALAAATLEFEAGAGPAREQTATGTAGFLVRAGIPLQRWLVAMHRLSIPAAAILIIIFNSKRKHVALLLPLRLPPHPRPAFLADAGVVPNRENLDSSSPGTNCWRAAADLDRRQLSHHAPRAGRTNTSRPARPDASFSRFPAMPVRSLRRRRRERRS